VSWITKRIDDRGSVTEETRSNWGRGRMPIVFSDIYEESYRLARVESAMETIYTKSGLLSLFENYKRGVESKNPLMFLSKLHRQADGEFTFGSDWEEPIVSDLINLLENWPT
jgi:hypothetical protein